MAIYSGFTHWKWWFSIVMLVYQRVVLARVSFRVFANFTSSLATRSIVPLESSWSPVNRLLMTPNNTLGELRCCFWAIWDYWDYMGLCEKSMNITSKCLKNRSIYLWIIILHTFSCLQMVFFWFHGYFSRPSSRNVPSQGCRQVTNIPHGSIMLYDSFVDHRAVEHRGEEDRWTITGGR